MARARKISDWSHCRFEAFFDRKRRSAITHRRAHTRANNHAGTPRSSPARLTCPPNDSARCFVAMLARAASSARRPRRARVAPRVSRARIPQIPKSLVTPPTVSDLRHPSARSQAIGASMNLTAAAPSMRRAVRRASPAAVSTKVRSNRDARLDRVRRVRKTLKRASPRFAFFGRFRDLTREAFLPERANEATGRGKEKTVFLVFCLSPRLTQHDSPLLVLSRERPPSSPRAPSP